MQYCQRPQAKLDNVAKKKREKGKNIEEKNNIVDIKVEISHLLAVQQCV